MVEEFCHNKQIKMKYATNKHPQTVKIVGRSHPALKNYLFSYEECKKRDWHLRVDRTVTVYNTTCLVSIGCTLTMIFFVRDPTKAKDMCRQNSE